MHKQNIITFEIAVLGMTMVALHVTIGSLGNIMKTGIRYFAKNTLSNTLVANNSLR